MSFASTWSIRGPGGGSEAFSAPTGLEDLSSAPSAAEFARTVRSRRWSSVLPLLASTAVGAAMLWVAAAPPPGVEARDAYRAASRSDPMYRDPAADVRYEPTPNWVWPSLSTELSQPPMVSCSEAVARSHC